MAGYLSEKIRGVQALGKGEKLPTRAPEKYRATFSIIGDKKKKALSGKIFAKVDIPRGKGVSLETTNREKIQSKGEEYVGQGGLKEDLCAIGCPYTRYRQ